MAASGPGRRLGLTTIAVALVGVLAGCSQDVATVSGSASSTAPVAAATAAPAAPVVLPEYGGTLRIASAGPVVWSDPTGNVTAAGAELSRLTSRQLVGYDGVDSLADRQDPKQDVATSPGDVSDDKLSVTFRLRQLEYAPPLTSTLQAADVVFGLSLLCDPNHPSADAARLAAVVVGYAAFCAGLEAVPRGRETAVRTFIDGHPISGINVMSKQVFKIRLTKPTGSLGNVLAQPDTSPFPEAAFSPARGIVSWVQAPALGPYVRVSTPTGLTFSRNTHWDAAQDELRRAYVDHVIVTDMGTPLAADAAVRSGQADLTLASGELGVSLTPSGGGVLRTSVAGDLIALVPSASAPGACSTALANPEVRRALAIAVDRRPVVASLGATSGQVSQWPLPDGVLGAVTSPPTGTVVGADSGLAFPLASASASALAPSSAPPSARATASPTSAASATAPGSPAAPASPAAPGSPAAPAASASPTASSPAELSSPFASPSSSALSGPSGSSAPTVEGPAQLAGEALTPGGAGDPARASTLLRTDVPSTDGRLTCTVTASDAASGVPDPALAGVLAALPRAFSAAGVTLRTSRDGPAALSVIRLTSSWRGDSADELLSPLLAQATDPVLLAAATRAEAENDQNLAEQRWALVAEVLVQDGAMVPLAEDRVASISSPRVRNFRWLNLARDADLANLSLAG